MSAINPMWYEGRWYQWLLLPLMVLFAVISASRRWLFRLGIKTSQHPGVPVIVVGNLSVGGNGKTPLVVALCERLSRAGFRVGVVSRGYGAKPEQFPHRVAISDSAEVAGDEPLLIAKRTGLPVVIDPVRPRGAKCLVEQHGCNVIICDDGLQHYALKRDIECVVTDSRLFGNGFLLPMGPLREGLWRLNHIDFLILNQRSEQIPSTLTKFQPVLMQLAPTELVNVVNPQVRKEASSFCGQADISAMAGIGDPFRFFNQLETMGITLNQAIALPDHHQIVAQDIPDGCVIMTEKDAVKVASFAHEDCWYQPVDAILPESFYTLIEEKLSRLAH